MKRQKHLSILMILVLSFTTFINPMVAFADSDLDFDNNQIEMEQSDADAVLNDVVVDEAEDESEETVEEEVVKQEEKVPVKNKGDPVKKKQKKGTPEKKVAKDVTKENNTKNDEELEKKKESKIQSKDKEKNNVEEKHVSDMTDDERDSLNYAIDSSLSRFITKSYMTPLIDENASYEGKVRYEYEIPAEEEISANTKYIIPTYSGDLQKFASPKDVDTIWNKGTRWIPSNDTDDLGRPLVYYSYKDDGLIEVIFSEDIVSGLEIKGWVEFNFFRLNVEKKILYQGEELDYLEVNEGEPFKYLIRYKMDENSDALSVSYINDYFDELLEMNWDTVKAYDQYGNDYTSQLKNTNHKVTLNPLFDVDKGDHRGKIITIEVDAKIKEQAKFNKEIPNVASITQGANVRDSNEVIVKKVKYELPNIEKDVEGKEHLEIDRNKEYKYNVKVDVPTELGGYKDLTITDTLDKRLDVVGAKVLIDGKASDYKASIDGQAVTVKLDRKQLNEIAGKKVNLQITSKIKSGIDIEKIPNKASIQLNDNPIVDSNVVTVIPLKTGSVTVEHIAVDKDGKKIGVLKEKRDVLRDVEVGTKYSTSERWFKGYRFARVNPHFAKPEGKVVEGDLHVVYEYKADGKILIGKVDFEKQDSLVCPIYEGGKFLSGNGLSGATFVLYDADMNEVGKYVTDELGQISIEGLDYGKYFYKEIEAPEGYKLDDTLREVNISTEGYDNGISCNVVSNDKIPKVPVIKKDVEDQEHLEVGHEKEYNYNVKTKIPKDLGGYKDLTIADTLDKRLDVVKAAVLVDGKASDFEATIKGQTVTLKLDRKQLDTIAGKEINVQITSKIKSGTDIEKVPNKATVQLNDNPTVDSNVVTVIPPKPTTPEVKKDVEGEDHLEVAHGKTYNYNVKTNIPKQLNGYKDLTLTDVLDNRLDVVGAKVLVDGKASDFEAKIDGQTVTLKLDRKQLDTIAGKEVNLQITAKIKSGTDIELIDNKATIQLNDNPDVDSNVVTVIPPTPTTPELVKDVEGREHLEIIKGEEYNYNIKTNIPDNLGGYKSLVIKDILDERLEVVGAKVFSGGDEVDFEVDIDGQAVKLTLDRKQLETVKRKELVVQITAKIIEDAPIELIDNKATIQLNDNPSEDSNVVTVIPPKPVESIPEPPVGQKPEEPKQPEQKQKVEVKPEEPVNEETIEVSEGKPLPNTATKMYNLLLVGFMLLLTGGVFCALHRKRRKSVQK